MKTVPVSAHTRRPPEKAPDPFAPVMAARRRAFAAKWGVELVGSDDPRLAAPVPAPTKAASAMSLDEISEQLHGLADQMSRIGREAE